MHEIKIIRLFFLSLTFICILFILGCGGGSSGKVSSIENKGILILGKLSSTNLSISKASDIKKATSKINSNVDSIELFSFDGVLLGTTSLSSDGSFEILVKESLLPITSIITDDISKYATHLIAKGLDSNKNIVSKSIIGQIKVQEFSITNNELVIDDTNRQQANNIKVGLEETIISLLFERQVEISTNIVSGSLNIGTKEASIVQGQIKPINASTPNKISFDSLNNLLIQSFSKRSGALNKIKVSFISSTIDEISSALKSTSTSSSNIVSTITNVNKTLQVYNNFVKNILSNKLIQGQKTLISNIDNFITQSFLEENTIKIESYFQLIQMMDSNLSIFSSSLPMQVQTNLVSTIDSLNTILKEASSSSPSTSHVLVLLENISHIYKNSGLGSSFLQNHQLLENLSGSITSIKGIDQTLLSVELQQKITNILSSLEPLLQSNIDEIKLLSDRKDRQEKLKFIIDGGIRRTNNDITKRLQTIIYLQDKFKNINQADLIDATNQVCTKYILGDSDPINQLPKLLELSKIDKFILTTLKCMSKTIDKKTVDKTIKKFPNRIFAFAGIDIRITTKTNLNLLGGFWHIDSNGNQIDTVDYASWSVTSGPSPFVNFISSKNSLNTTVEFTEPSIYELTLSLSGSSSVTSDTIIIDVYQESASFLKSSTQPHKFTMKTSFGKKQEDAFFILKKRNPIQSVIQLK